MYGRHKNLKLRAPATVNTNPNLACLAGKRAGITLAGCGGWKQEELDGFSFDPFLTEVYVCRYSVRM